MGTTVRPPIQTSPPNACRDQVAGRWNFAWQAIPGWLVSLLLHLGILLCLAVLSQGNALPSVGSLAIEFAMGDSQFGDFEIASAASSQIAAPEPTSLESAMMKFETLEAVELNPDLEAIGVAPAPRSINLTSILESGLDSKGDLESMSSNALSGLMNGVEFFGVKSEGKRFVFVVDSSNSMRGGRFRDAKIELLKAIQRLSKDQSFYVLFFDHDAARMTFAPDTDPVPGLVFATRENIDKLQAWVETVENELQTNPLEAMQFAVAMIPDAIYLLSDGKFTDRGRTLEFLQIGEDFKESKKLKRPKVVIHTLGFYSRDSENTLKQISDSYHGIYRFVPDPTRRSKKDR